MATKTRKRPKTGTALDHATHYMRFIRAEDGESAAAIARSEGVTVRSIEKSLRTVRQEKALHTQANLTAALMGMMLRQVPKVNTTFDRMLDAKEYVVQNNPDGSTNLIPVDDKTIQLEALKAWGSFMSAMQPKTGGGVNVSVQQNNSNKALAVSGGRGGYEEMLHQVIKESKDFNALPSITADVLDDEDFSEDDEDDEVLTVR